MAEEQLEVRGAMFTRIEDPDYAFRWDLTLRGDFVGAIVVRVDDVVRVSTGFTWVDAVDLEAANQVLAIVRQLGCDHPGRPVAVSVTDPLVRNVLRNAGYTGPLRGSLRSPSESASVPGPRSDLSKLETLLPGFELEVRRESKRTIRLRVSGLDAPGRLVVAVERRPMLIEQVAMVIDTAIAVQLCLAPLTRSLRSVLLGNAAREEMSPKFSGLAHDARGAFSINGRMLYVSDLDEHRRDRLGKGRRLEPIGRPRHYGAADIVAAHESWHLIDHDVVGKPRSYIAFHRALGEVLGVDTLEHALRGRERGAPAAWRDANAELATQVSDYATTNPREATAEMFAAWWGSTSDLSPVVARFVSLVEERLGRELVRSSSELAPGG